MPVKLYPNKTREEKINLIQNKNQFYQYYYEGIEKLKKEIK